MTATLFPRAKRVRYADPLAREIRTELYVKSHYELVVALEEEEEKEKEKERETDGAKGGEGEGK
ncbi:hypothetical protein GP486_007847, partial [Trichoglossum hirsutum]